MDEFVRARILAAVVSFHPEVAKLTPLLRELRKQCGEVLIIDNTPGVDDSLWQMLEPSLSEYTNLRVCRLGRNLGLGAAFNVAMEVASQEGFSHLLLSDQDSLPRPGMINGLLEAEHASGAFGLKVAAVGPLCFDSSSGKTLSFQCREPGHFFYRRKLPTTLSPDQQVVSLISSGSLLCLQALQRTGGFREDFLVDNVDMEWCLRARANGFAIIGTSRAVLEHRLGGEPIRFWFFGEHREPGYEPQRLYYRFRNFAFMLMRLPHVPMWWAISASLYWVKVALLHVTFVPRRRQSAAAILLGLVDGIRGRMSGGALSRVAQGAAEDVP